MKEFEERQRHSKRPENRDKEEEKEEEGQNKRRRIQEDDRRRAEEEIEKNRERIYGNRDEKGRDDMMEDLFGESPDSGGASASTGASP
eukprot:10629462-Karenia_brevis.AAC.1